MSYPDYDTIECDECGAYNCKIICLCEECTKEKFAKSQEQGE